MKMVVLLQIGFSLLFCYVLYKTSIAISVIVIAFMNNNVREK
jgi:hypothetical protein